VGGHSGAEQSLQPVVGTARYHRDPSKHRDAHTQRQKSRAAWPVFCGQPVEEFSGLRDDHTEQSRCHRDFVAWIGRRTL
jgi:hypothetical protein